MSPEVEERDLTRSAFRVGEWLVQPSLNRLIRGETSIQLELKVMDVLVCLARRAGEVVSRRELTDTVWATEFISDNTVSHAVAELRGALGDDAKQPRYVETIHRRGYRLIAAVEMAGPDDPGSSTVARFPSPARSEPAVDERSPYPGLAAFTEEDAEYFFGREAEVARMWRKLTSRRLLAVIGPSGVGKSSFLRAGVIPAKPEGWGAIVCQPGEGPFGSLARALVPEFGADTDAVTRLVGIRDPAEMVAIVSRWRERHEQALLVVDQFEELFTQNPPEVQAGFAGLLRKLVDDADVHLVLAMRDDFLYRCQALEPLHTVLDGLFALEQPDSESLRRALVEPARRQGYAFEDDALPREMTSEVEGERGALPMLAFAVARLWEKRNRERRLLTRQAYADIGKVGGALAKHAEATLTALGDARLPIVRELFRNLVTAEGTRAVREWDELLSVFCDSSDESPEEVLRELIDARLLTSYELREDDRAPTRRVEIIHESLLGNWPRLVRWQTQDADAAQLRDQLRQAARTWNEHGRTADYLWSGKAYREFAVWRESYPGGLTDLEEAFASAMTSFANRRRRRRRIAATAAIILTMVVASVFGVLWRRSVLETRRAEAAKLLAVAQAQLETDPAEALAYATSSLVLTDTNEARIFVIKALWAGPPVRVLEHRSVPDSFRVPTFSPDGRWLAVAGLVSENVLVYGQNGADPTVLGGHKVSASDPIQCAWTRDGLLVTGHWTEGRARLWAMPEGRLVREIDLGGPAIWMVGDSHLLAHLLETDPASGEEIYRLRSWELPDGEPEELGTVKTVGVFDRGGGHWVYREGDDVYACPLPITAGLRETLIARQDNVRLNHWRRPQGFFSSDDKGNIILWTSPRGTSLSGRLLVGPETATVHLKPESQGRWAADWNPRRGQRALLWDLEALASAQPVELRRSGVWYFSFVDFCPDRDWVVSPTHNGREVSFWPLPRVFPAIVKGYDTSDRQPVVFTKDGRYLVTNWKQDRVRLWPIPGNSDLEVVDLMLPDSAVVRNRLAIDPSGEHVLSMGYGSEIFLLSTVGGETRQFKGFPPSDYVVASDFSPSGKLVAAASQISNTHPTLRVWDLETDDVRVFDLPQRPVEASEESGLTGYYVFHLAFTDESTVYTDGYGLLRWNLETGACAQLVDPQPGGTVFMLVTPDRRMMATYRHRDSQATGIPVDLENLVTGDTQHLLLPADGRSENLNSDGSIWIAGGIDGLIKVVRTNGSDEHLLAGHEGPLKSLAISPDNEWIASSGEDKTLRLWPMPDLSKPPLHTLPHDELIAKLHSLTNLRAVRDPESSTGWKIEVGPFPGWAEVPEW